MFSVTRGMLVQGANSNPLGGNLLCRAFFKFRVQLHRTQIKVLFLFSIFREGLAAQTGFMSSKL